MTTYSINEVKVKIGKTMKGYTTWFCDISDDLLLEACQFESENFYGKFFKTQKGIKKMVDDFAMKVRS